MVHEASEQPAPARQLENEYGEVKRLDEVEPVFFFADSGAESHVGPSERYGGRQLAVSAL